MHLNSSLTSTPKIGCGACSDATALDFDFTMAFQPIIDLQNKKIFAHEALVRGLNGESAWTIINQTNEKNLYKFDQTCRVKAVSLAAKLGIESFLSINFLPNAVYQPENCLRTTIKAARENDFPLEKIIFEITEVEKAKSNAQLKEIVTEYKRQGFKTAIDDFGAGYSGLNLLSVFQPDFLKLDMELIRDIDVNAIKQTIVKSITQVANDLNITLIVEGIETRNELNVLRNFGINLFQGYFFARPAFEALAEVSTEFCLQSRSVETYDVESETLCVV